jgi:hypothetical protein
MADMRSSMRKLAEVAADEARAPGAQAAVRRGRRRRRSRIYGVAALVVVLVAGAGWLRGGPHRVTATTVPAASRPTIVAGEASGIGWRIEHQELRRDELCVTLRLEVPGSERDRLCAPLGTIVSLGTGTGFDTSLGRLKPQVAVVDQRVARVRLWYDNPGRYSEFSDAPPTTTPGTRTAHARVEAVTVGSHSGPPVRFVVIVIPADAGVTRLEAFDVQGRVLCDGDPWAEEFCQHP